MNRLAHTRNSAVRRSNRVRAKISGTTERPRLSIHISNLHISAQIINDEKNVTLAFATTVGQKREGTMSEKATWVGEEIAKKAKKVKIAKVALDRGSRKYHGRVKNLAEAARAAGLEF